VLTTAAGMILPPVREIPGSMDPGVVAKIDEHLAEIQSEAHVAIPLGIERGSRAWGFPSPDSDYDCRFIFVRARNTYLSLLPERDVIETPLEDNLDVHGWDIAKALKLLLKGNAVVIEWLTSPITYTADKRFRLRLLGSRETCSTPRICCSSLSSFGRATAPDVFGKRKRSSAEEGLLRLTPRCGASLAPISSKPRGRANVLSDLDLRK